MRKVFRVIKNDLACPEAYHPLWYRIEQRHTLLFFFHWWTTPEFEPPHNFENVCDAMKHIKEHYPNAVVYDYYSENKLSNKVMKANELMIGDLLKWKEQPGFNDEDRNMVLRVKNIFDDAIKIDGRFELYHISLFEPIPVTPDILEKNGFEKVYDKYKLPNYRIKWNSYTDLYFTVFTGVDGYWNPIGLNVITGGIPATVDYVHQLQNALRLCGIEKEIIL